MFSRFKDKKRRLSLEQNPHFYEALPSSPKTYGGEFRMNPIQTFQYEGISVLIDNPDRAGRVFLETAGKVRVFGNVWDVNDTIIFKGSWLFMGFPPSLTPCQTSVEGLRVKASSGRPSKVYPTYGVLRSVFYLLPPSPTRRLHLFGSAHPSHSP
jgi:hypothetical protein